MSDIPLPPPPQGIKPATTSGSGIPMPPTFGGFPMPPMPPSASGTAGASAPSIPLPPSTIGTGGSGSVPKPLSTGSTGLGGIPMPPSIGGIPLPPSPSKSAMKLPPTAPSQGSSSFPLPPTVMSQGSSPFPPSPTVMSQGSSPFPPAPPVAPSQPNPFAPTGSPAVQSFPGTAFPPALGDFPPTSVPAAASLFSSTSFKDSQNPAPAATNPPQLNEPSRSSGLFKQQSLDGRGELADGGQSLADQESEVRSRATVNVGFNPENEIFEVASMAQKTPYNTFNDDRSLTGAHAFEGQESDFAAAVAQLEGHRTSTKARTSAIDKGISLATDDDAVAPPVAAAPEREVRSRKSQYTSDPFAAPTTLDGSVKDLQRATPSLPNSPSGGGGRGLERMFDGVVGGPPGGQDDRAPFWAVGASGEEKSSLPPTVRRSDSDRIEEQFQVNTPTRKSVRASAVETSPIVAQRVPFDPVNPVPPPMTPKRSSRSYPQLGQPLEFDSVAPLPPRDPQSSEKMSVAFGFGGRLLASQGNSVSTYKIEDLIMSTTGRKADHHKAVINELRDFPGPLAAADPETTDKLIVFYGRPEHLIPRSGLLDKLLVHLLQVNGDREVAYEKFLDDLGNARDDPETNTVTGPLRRLARGIALNNIDDALEKAANSRVLWPHVLIISKLLSKEAYFHTLSRFSSAVAAANTEAYTPTVEEREDGFVRALTQLYDLMAQEKSMDEMVDSILDCWEPAVAIIVRLLTPKSEKYGYLIEKYLVALGNKLCKKGQTSAGHICFLLTKVHALESVDTPSGLIALLGVEHRNPVNFTQLLDPRYLHWSETFEYCMRLQNEQFFFTGLQPFKMAHAAVLADYGMTEKAEKYLNLTKHFIRATPNNKYCDSFFVQMRELQEKLHPTGDYKSHNQKFLALQVTDQVKNWFTKGAGALTRVKEVTGFATKPIGAPEYRDEDAYSSKPGSGGFSSPQPTPGGGGGMQPPMGAPPVQQPPGGGGFPSGAGSLGPPMWATPPPMGATPPPMGATPPPMGATPPPPFGATPPPMGAGAPPGTGLQNRGSPLGSGGMGTTSPLLVTGSPRGRSAGGPLQPSAPFSSSPLQQSSSTPAFSSQAGPPGPGGFPSQPPGVGGFPPQPPGAGGYQPQPSGVGGFPPQPPGVGGFPPQPPGAGGYQPPSPGGYQPPSPGGYQPPSVGGYQPPGAGGYQQPPYDARGFEPQSQPLLNQSPGAPPRSQVVPIEDPILKAGKAVFGGFANIIRSVAGKEGGDNDDPNVYQKLGTQNAMYYDEAAGRWRDRTATVEEDASKYDPMTGKLLERTDFPPPPMASEMPAAAAGGPPKMQTAFQGGRRGPATGNLYVAQQVTGANFGFQQ